MNPLILPVIAIILPVIGMLLALFLSQLEDSWSYEGKTRDWIIAILIFLPLVPISFLMIPHMHSGLDYSIAWLPGLKLGIRLHELSTAFACIISSISAIFAFYSIDHMAQDRHRTRYWFFYQLLIAAMMMGIFSNNIIWLYGSFTIASFASFFLISHWHRKSGDEGEKAGKAAIRYLLFNGLGDLILLIGLGLLYYAFGSPLLGEIKNAWLAAPQHLIGASSITTRLVIQYCIFIGSLIKSAQIPLLFWPSSGDKTALDLAKTPLPLAGVISLISVGISGLYVIQNFFPMFSTKSVEIGTTTSLFQQGPFDLVAWCAIITIIYCLIITLVSENINRIVITAAIGQISFAFLGIGAGNTLGYVSSVFHLITGIPSASALLIIYGMVIQSLKMRDLSNLGGLGEKLPKLYIFGFIVTTCFVGIFPASIFFSKDMIFLALCTNSTIGHYAITILAMICSLGFVFSIGKLFMRTFYGSLSEDLAVRKEKIISIISAGLVTAWSVIAGICFVLFGYPVPVFTRGLLNSFSFTLYYDFPIFSDWLISLPMFFLPLLVAVGTFFLYRDGTGRRLDGLRDHVFIRKIRAFFANGMYLDRIYRIIIIYPISAVSKLLALNRLAAHFWAIIWIIFALILLVAASVLIGGL